MSLFFFSYIVQHLFCLKIVISRFLSCDTELIRGLIRVFGGKIALRSDRSLNSNHAMFTTTTVSHCLLNFEILRSAIGS